MSRGEKMQVFNRIIAMSRASQLGRQLREVEQIVANMTGRTKARLAVLALRELDQATRCEFPHLYGTPPEARYRLWGAGTDLGIERARSDNLQVRMRGIALWLAVAYHETRDAPFPETQKLFRRVQGIVRELKELAPPDSRTNAVA